MSVNDVEKSHRGHKSRLPKSNRRRSPPMPQLSYTHWNFSYPSNSVTLFSLTHTHLTLPHSCSSLALTFIQHSDTHPTLSLCSNSLILIQNSHTIASMTTPPKFRNPLENFHIDWRILNRKLPLESASCPTQTIQRPNKSFHLEHAQKQHRF